MFENVADDRTNFGWKVNQRKRKMNHSLCSCSSDDHRKDSETVKKKSKEIKIYGTSDMS
jgi:hypothetical protein